MPFHPGSAVLVLFGALLLPVGANGAAADPVCRGEAATLVGVPGSSVQGTEEDDVIVSNGALEVTAVGGDDLICVTGRASRTATTTVYAGRGVDTVDTAAATGPSTYVDLGGGRDLFFGGSHADFVQLSGGLDTVDTGGGNDTVQRGNGTFLDDHVKLGKGSDTFLYGPGFVEGAAKPSPDGGPGTDRIVLTDGERFDAVRGLGYRDGMAYYSWVHFEHYAIGNPDKGALFVGSPRSEVVEITGSGAPITLRMGGGDDILKTGVSSGRAHRFALFGGPGRDGLEIDGRLSPGVSVVADLPAHRVSVSVPSRDTVTGSIHDVQDVGAFSVARATMLGNHSNNRLVVRHGCRSVLRGGAGNDQLFALFARDATDCGAAMHGGDGNDLLRGGATDDVLVGDAGMDLAYGGAGNDRCRAETVKLCES